MFLPSRSEAEPFVDPALPGALILAKEATAPYEEVVSVPVPTEGRAEVPVLAAFRWTRSFRC